MFPRTRKSQSDNGSAGGTAAGVASVNGSEDASVSSSPTTTISPNSIPPNKGGKAYTMNEVFQVWHDNKEQILNPSKELPVNQNENYKLARPNQIYHLDLQLESSLGRDINSHSELADHHHQDVPAELGLAGPPPGLAPSVTSVPLLSSDRIEWYYIDPLGTEQGPFNGDMMQEWLTGGYLDLELRIRRKEEFSFKPLKELCESVQNYIQPFKVPLPDLAAQAPEQLQHHFTPPFGQSIQPLQGLSIQPLQGQSIPGQSIQGQPQLHQFLNGQLGSGAASMRMNPSLNQTNLFGSDFINPDPFAPAPLNFQNSTGSFIDPMHQNLGFNNLNINTLLQQQIQPHPQPTLSRNNSGWAMDGLISNPGTPAGTNPGMAIPQQTPISPWIAGVQSQSRVSSPFIPEKAYTGDNVLDEIHSSVTDILDYKKDDKEKPQPEVAEEPVKEPEPVALPAPEPVVEKQPVKEKVAVKAAKEAVKEAAKVPQPASQPAPQPETVLAPWADQNLTAKPALTLKEIQALEAEKLQKQKQLQSQLRSEQAAARSWAAVDEPEEKPALPATTGWAVNNKPAVAQKTLAEIQKDEAEAAAAKAKAAKAKAAKAAALAATATSATPFAAGPIPASYGSSFASTLANSVPKDDAWTTVAAKKPPVKKQAAPSITNSASASRANPQLLRSVSAARPAAPSVNYTALREDFLVWARSSMTNLYPTVSKDDLLDIFITLPASSADSAQLISETIYSSSATMDGRRFAQEFLKRRQKVDQQIGASDDVAWSAAIITSANKVQTVDEDGWSTNVKGKKKGKKA